MIFQNDLWWFPLVQNDQPLQTHLQHAQNSFRSFNNLMGNGTMNWVFELGFVNCEHGSAKGPKLQIPGFIHGGLLRPSSNSLALTTTTTRRHTHLLSSSSSSSHVIRAVSTVWFYSYFFWNLNSLSFRLCSFFGDLFGCRESARNGS